MLRISFAAWTGALVISGLALARAAALKQGGVAPLTVIFLLLALAAPLLLLRQVKQLLASEDEPESFPLLQECRTGEAADAFTPPTPEPSPQDDEEALRRSQKALAIERLRDGISHDLNNRLMVISANIDAVARQMKDQPIQQRKLLSALVAADQAAKLIASTAAFARQSQPKVQNVDLAERVSAVASLMSRSLLRDTVELRLEMEDDLWPVRADPDDIATALVTLSAHLRDALPQGGAITIDARNVRVERGTLSDRLAEGDFVKLAIRSGGMARPALDTGEQAFSVNDIDLSAWLRLSQCLHFLELIGGQSEVRRSGNETVIALYLPRAHAAAMLTSGLLQDDDAQHESDAANRLEILVVDDELEVALALQSMLEESGYVAIIATDAAQAMRSLTIRRPGLVLTDVAMPGTMNGLMLAREVRQLHPDLPIVLITGRPGMAEEGGEFPVLRKPIVSRDLHAAIQRHLTLPDEGKVVALFPRQQRKT